MVVKTQVEDHMTKTWFISIPLLLPLAVSAQVYVTIIQGLGGAATYDQQFSEQVDKLRTAAESVTDNDRIHVLAGADATREDILEHFTRLGNLLSSIDRIAVLMIGHGSYDEFEYKFMIPGPDLTDTDMVELLDKVPAANQLVVNTGSASGALLESLKSEGRIVITATRSGNERLATRFGGYFAEAFDDPAADINKNNAISVQEAFDYATRQVQDYFEYEGTLATEHPVLEGEMANQFVLARPGPVLTERQDPRLLNLFGQRDEIDRSIEALQLRRNELEPENYLEQLQALMIQLSLTQGEIDSIGTSDEGNE